MRRTFLTLFLATTGCGLFSSSPDTQCTADPAPAATEARAVFGRSADDVFTDVATNDTFDVQHGLQGGQHIDVALKFHTGEGGSWRCTLRFDDASGTELGRTEVEVDGCASGWTQTDSIRLVLDEDGSRSGSITASLSPTEGSAVPIEASWTVQLVDE